MTSPLAGESGANGIAPAAQVRVLKRKAAAIGLFMNGSIALN
jgi:hypothetical protein